MQNKEGVKDQTTYGHFPLGNSLEEIFKSYLQVHKQETIPACLHQQVLLKIPLRNNFSLPKIPHRSSQKLIVTSL